MKNKKAIIYIILEIVICVVVSFLSIEITKLYFSVNGNEDYKKLGLEIDEYDIEYCTIYTEDFLDGKYKVYKLKNYYTDCMQEFRTQLESSNLWDRNKYYEYIMKEFSEIIEADIYDAISMQTCVNGRNIVGGPAEQMVKRAICYAEEFLNNN